MYDPERPVEPREPEVFDRCVLCGGEIYMGERYYRATLGNVCRDCAEGLPFTEEVAGEDA